MAESPNEVVWRAIFEEGEERLKSYQHVHRLMPPWRLPRDECRLCYTPFTGLGGWIMRQRGVGRSTPNRFYCSRCDSFIRNFPGGAKVNLSMFHVDIKDSTAISQKLEENEWADFIHRFYEATFETLMKNDAFILEIEGDGIITCFPPGFVGGRHALIAVKSAENLLKARSNGAIESPIKIGVHTGGNWIGTIHKGEKTPEGWSPPEGWKTKVHSPGGINTVVHRLTKIAGADEALITEETCKAAGIDFSPLEGRTAKVDGIATPISVRVLRADSPALTVEGLSA